jgi:hypothetical protein
MAKTDNIEEELEDFDPFDLSIDLRGRPELYQKLTLEQKQMRKRMRERRLRIKTEQEKISSQNEPLTNLQLMEIKDKKKTTCTYMKQYQKQVRKKAQLLTEIDKLIQKNKVITLEEFNKLKKEKLTN